ncbi:PRC-barrel domain-containing protein [Pedobacter mucosus]|uniref:PRC-barrel domain-containing protein n=1 Tax=Pedobacter mucosus TaxID=2895286 RepID=UPI001EE4B13B|nr:PRC-barrel domain-containing protein [Pedobacter mucosus]UKT65614.1 PRC-barrel domain-containing protein [Pedobacter mucosus]
MNTGNIVYLKLEELSKVDYQLGDGEANITGWPVTDETEKTIGKVRDLLVDIEQNAVRYLIVDLDDSISGVEDKAVILPIGFVKLGEDKKEVVVPVLHENQFLEMPQYIIGEVTRDTELKIRSAIGSPAALRIEEEINENDHSEFYSHHHFDRGNIGNAGHDVQSIDTTQSSAFITPEPEMNSKFDIVDQSELNTAVNYENAQSTPNVHEQFNITTEEGTFTIEPQDNGTYRILEGENKIGVIYAEPAEEGVRWQTMDQLNDQFVSKIGDGITEHNSSSSDF